MKNGSSRNDTTPFSMSCVEVYELNVCFFLFNVQMAKKDMIQLTELYDWLHGTAMRQIKMVFFLDMTIYTTFSWFLIEVIE